MISFLIIALCFVIGFIILVKRNHRKYNGIIVAIIFLVGLGLLGCNLYFRLPVTSYLFQSEVVCKIPGLNEGLVPQCITFTDDSILFSGYRIKSKEAPVYLIDKKKKRLVKKVIFTGTDGHSGGMTVHKNYIYMTDNRHHRLLAYLLSDVKKAEQGEKIAPVGSVSLESEDDHIKPAFVTALPEGILVGEFYRSGNYETHDSHWLEASGSQHHSLAILLPYIDKAPGIASKPTVAYSLPDLVQGMCSDNDGNIFISSSYGMAFSRLEIHNRYQMFGNIMVIGTRVPLIMLDDNTLMTSMKMEPMSEEIEVSDGMLYITNESASRKYFFGNLYGANKVRAISLKNILEKALDNK